MFLSTDSDVAWYWRHDAATARFHCAPARAAARQSWVHCTQNYVAAQSRCVHVIMSFVGVPTRSVFSCLDYQAHIIASRSVQQNLKVFCRPKIFYRDKPKESLTWNIALRVSVHWSVDILCRREESSRQHVDTSSPGAYLVSAAHSQRVALPGERQQVLSAGVAPARTVAPECAGQGDTEGETESGWTAAIQSAQRALEGRRCGTDVAQVDSLLCTCVQRH